MSDESVKVPSPRKLLQDIFRLCDEQMEDIKREADNSKPYIASRSQMEFLEAIQGIRSAYREQKKAFGEAFERDLKADGERQQKIAEEWSVCNGDGLTPSTAHPTTDDKLK